VERSVTAEKLFSDLHERLDLAWVFEPDVEEHPVLSGSHVSARPDLAGFLNLIHPNQIQVLGYEELNFINSLDDLEKKQTEKRILHGNPLAILVGDQIEVPDLILDCCRIGNIPLWKSGRKSWELVDFLQYHVAHLLAHRTILHGVFMEIFTIGVQISGDAACGKSELALELLTRGHRLIADDAPEFTQISPEVVEGSCPAALQDCLEVRGLGILNVRQMFGDSAIKMNKFLRLIINLRLPSENIQADLKDRLRGDTSTQKVLNVNVPQINLPVLPGRNMAVIAEAAVRDFMLKMKGIDSASEFIKRHNRLMEKPG
jgi:HPr kinase/phosphorylase